MAIPLHLLIVEDSEQDAALMLRELQRGGYDVKHERVDNEEAMRAAISREGWDIILSDFSTPQFSALAALALAHEAGLDIPFIIVSGAVGEETAADAMRSGARDFVLKGNLKRLVPVIERELEAARVRRERKAADAKLDFERRLLQQLMNGSPDAISIKDAERRYIRLNEAERRTLNVEPNEDVCGKAADAFIAPERARLQHEDEGRVLSTGEPVFDSVETLVEEHGAVRWLSATRAPIRGAHGEIAGIVAISRDITEAKRNEQMKNEFVATVNHELRTPLTAIIGALRLMGGTGPTGLAETSKRLLDIALVNCDRLSRIVNDILDFERIESGTMAYRKQQVDARALTEQTIEACQVIARSHDVRVRLAEGAPHAVLATDPDRLVQVITNLLSNAIKFSPCGAEVLVAIEASEDVVRISVHDSGPGIPAEYKDRIFEKFVQVDATDARSKGGGTGLGLAISKQMARQLGGDVRLTDSRNGGSSFQLELRRS